ncbi:MAG TPA: PQQ-dependent dehydrogenase, methanol/ethanol family [Steroidobacteraceae bacterium]
MSKSLPVLVAMLALVCACARDGRPSTPQAANAIAALRSGAVDVQRLTNADADVDDWLTYGRTYSEQRFSPLKQINSRNVSQLKLAWHYDLPTDPRVHESTPLMVDGTLYMTGSWSRVFALEARTGALLWSYDPKVAGPTAVNACCDVGNRGVAVWNGKVYVGTLDGRLIALDARTGAVIWSVHTTDTGTRYTITGAPRVVKGKVLIGNGGAEMGVRGYISAYDAETGALAWRFYTVPGDPSKPFENAAMEKAAKTWTGQWWKFGGGGTVWDSMAYDPVLDLLYIGVGNGSPWNRAIRSPGGGDNLFLSSIVALRPDTGEYVWHFQETPGESWDFTATQSLILADLTIGGQKRQVILQAPKNGFFYVIDRTNGQFISAQPFAAVNWAKGVDPTTGRPIETPDARYGETGKPWISQPGPGGAHNWQPMAFSPATGLVYIPVSDLSFPYFPDKRFAIHQLAWNTGADFNAGSLPQDEKIKSAAIAGSQGHLAAWDPVAQKEVWRVPQGHPWNGGVLATAGNLVFEGTSMGTFDAYQADTGKALWSQAVHTGIVAAPMTYQVGGEQYVAVLLGWGGAVGLAAGEIALASHTTESNVPRLLAFKLNGTDTIPLPPAQPRHTLQPPPDRAAAKTVDAGKEVYHHNCGVCHGDSATSGGVLPDLRYSSALSDVALWNRVVREGALESRGMVSFASELNQEQTDSIRAYVIHRANEDAARQPATEQRR